MSVLCPCTPLSLPACCAAAIPDQFRFISHRTTNNANWHHILSKLHPRFMVIVRHPIAARWCNLLSWLQLQPYPAQFCPVSSVAAPTATTSLLRCLFAAVATVVVAVLLLLMLKLLQVAAKKKNQICNLFLPINLVTFIKRGINFAFKNPSENAHTNTHTQPARNPCVGQKVYNLSEIEVASETTLDTWPEHLTGRKRGNEASSFVNLD